jgi:hypothetical protein
MMKIQQVQPYFVLRSKHRNNDSSPDFTGSKVYDGLKTLPKSTQKDLINYAKQQRDAKFSWLEKKIIHPFSVLLAEKHGEVQTQIINAMFTATLAPFWITHNPIPTNKTKEQKAYLAWRQPISATIALTGGLSVTLLCNRYIDSVFNEGHLKSIDLRMIPNKEYLKRFYKSNKQNGEKVKDFVKRIQKERENFYLALITEKEPSKIRVDEKTGSVYIGDKDLQKDLTIKIKNVRENDLKEFVKKNNLYSQTLIEFLEDRFKYETYTKGINKGRPKRYLNSQEVMHKVNALDFLTQIGLIEKNSLEKDDLKIGLLNVRKEKTAKLISKLLNMDLETAKKYMEIHYKEMGTILDLMEKTYDKSINLNELFHELDYHFSDANGVYGKGSLEKLQEKKMADVLIELKGILLGNLDKLESKNDLNYFAKNLLKQNLKALENNAKNYKFYTGIFVNLFVTAVTCAALNWTYPKIVKTFAPDLDKANRKGGKHHG